MLQKKFYPTGAGSGDATRLIAAHNAGDSSRSTVRNVSVASAVSSSAFGFSPPMAGRNDMQKKNMN